MLDLLHGYVLLLSCVFLSRVGIRLVLNFSFDWLPATAAELRLCQMCEIGYGPLLNVVCVRYV